MVGPALRQRHEDSLEEWNAFQSSLAPEGDSDLDLDVFSNLHKAMSQLRAGATLKQGYVYVMPYRLWEARNPAVASDILGTYQRQVGEGVKQHRITDYFLSEDSRWLPHWKTHARGEGLHAELDAELYMYECALHDGTLGEAYHVEFKRDCVTKTAGTFRYHVANVRTEQDEEEIDEHIQKHGKVLWHKWWNNHKCILQRKHRSLRHWKVRRLANKKFYPQVYRYGIRSHQDWSALKKLYLTTGQCSTKPARGILSATKKDFANTVFVVGRVYTVIAPALADAEPAPVESGGAAIAAVQPATSRLLCFEVLDTAPHTKANAAKPHVNHLFNPMQIQFWSIWARGDVQGYMPTSISCSPQSGPEIIDIMSMTTWEYMRGSLRVWQARCPSDVFGCVDFSRPIEYHVLVPFPLRTQTTPAWILFRKLAEDGWSMGDVDRHDLPLEDNNYSPNGVVGKKNYLLCLLDLERLAQRGLETLPANKIDSYYRVVLKSEKPADVEPDAGVIEFRKQLKEIDDDDAHEIPLALQADFHDPSVIKNLLPEPLMDLPGEVDAASAVGIIPYMVASSSSGAASSSDPPAAIVAAAPPAPVIHPTDSSGSSESASSSSGDESVAQPVVSLSVDTRPTLIYGEHIEGQKINIGTHYTKRTKYYRFHVVCPCTNTTHRDTHICQKYRNTGPMQTSKYGIAEVYAFLGLWLRRAAIETSKIDHGKYRPKDSDIAAYIREKEWVMPIP